MSTSSVKPGISYLDSLLKNNYDLKTPFKGGSKRKEKKLLDASQNICVIDIGKKKEVHNCLLCHNDYLRDEDELKTVYYKITKQQPPEGTIFFGRRYVKTKHEESICRRCANHLISCQICGEKFNHRSTTYGYYDSNLKKQVDVCLQCYSYEACASCGYLGGASPCRWCRHDM